MTNDCPEASNGKTQTDERGGEEYTFFSSLIKSDTIRIPALRYSNRPKEGSRKRRIEVDGKQASLNRLTEQSSHDQEGPGAEREETGFG